MAYSGALSHAKPSVGIRFASKLRHSKPDAKETKRESKSNVPKQPKKKGRLIIIIAIIVVVLAGIGASIGIVQYNKYRDEKKAQPFRFSDKLKISGIDISGLSYEKGEQKLKENAITAVDDKRITVKANGKAKTLTEKNFKYTYDFEPALENAKIYSLKEQGIYDEPTEPSATEYTEPETLEDGYTEIRLDYQLDDKSVTDVVKKLKKRMDVKPQDAKISKFHPFAKKRFEYQEGVNGSVIDSSKLETKLGKALSSEKTDFDFNAEVVEKAPKIDVKFLKKNIVGLSTATSTSYNTATGTNNMAVALKACNGSVINPGKVWSFNKCTGNSNLESNGYGSSTVIVDGEYVQGVGGGICQASTVIFQAAVLGNVDIHERHYHYYTSSYALSGEDATIDYPNLDLKLKNKTKFPVFLECRVDGTTLTANFYGYQEPTYDNVKMYSENYDITGYNYRTRTYRVLLLKGKEVSKEIVTYSVYSLSGGHSVKAADTEGTYRIKPDEKVTATQATEAQQEQTSPPPAAPATTDPPAPTVKPTAKPTTPPTAAPTEAEEEEDEEDDEDIVEIDIGEDEEEE